MKLLISIINHKITKSLTNNDISEEEVNSIKIKLEQKVL